MPPSRNRTVTSVPDGHLPDVASVLVVDPDPKVAQAIRPRLREAGIGTDSVASAAGALHRLAPHPPNLLLTEIVLPDLPGTELLRRIRARAETRRLPVIVVSERAAEVDRVVAFELGADDFVAKPFSAHELALRIRAVLRRATTLAAPASPTIVAGSLVLDLEVPNLRIDGRSVPLSPTELRLLSELIRHPGRVLSRQALLTAVWPRPTTTDRRAVDTAVRRLRARLGPLGDRIETVRGFGYRWRPDESASDHRRAAG
ncbi:MAG: response regulator transcription factor [Myxococcota bacterium]|nr:response regulator transcription factor [Myxococcota bacterium]MDW8361725.1 response regulator transcription factor [Myxococcales bacterium]